MAAEVTAVKLPTSFPEGTIFLDLQGLPVTARFAEGRYLDWEDREAPGPGRLPRTRSPAAAGQSRRPSSARWCTAPTHAHCRRCWCVRLRTCSSGGGFMQS